VRWTSWWGARTDDQAREVMDSIEEKQRRGKAGRDRIGLGLWAVLAFVVLAFLFARSLGA